MPNLPPLRKTQGPISDKQLAQQELRDDLDAAINNLRAIPDQPYTQDKFPQGSKERKKQTKELWKVCQPHIKVYRDFRINRKCAWIPEALCGNYSGVTEAKGPLTKLGPYPDWWRNIRLDRT